MNNARTILAACGILAGMFALWALYCATAIALGAGIGVGS